MRDKISALVWAAAAVLLTLSLVWSPETALESAKNGMSLFLNVVFPSLLPFFILSELMLGFGVVHFIGVLFEPLMRPLFNTPGEGAFVLSMGLAAGYPMDAVITARFRKQGLCTQIEGERMLAYSNTADPLFIFGAVAVGMFAIPGIGKTMAIAHYIGAFLVGIIFRFYGYGDRVERPEAARSGNIMGRALDALVKARQEDGRPFGQMLGDAVNDSIKTLLMICGFIMLFSTIVKIVEVVGLYALLAAPLSAFFKLLHISPELVEATINGLFEIDLGALAAAKAAAPLIQRVAIAGAIVAWSGLSVFGQVASVLTGTDIRMRPYILARLLHAVLAYLATLMLMRNVSPAILEMLPVVPVLGGMPEGLAQPAFWELFARGLMWSLGVPLALSLVGGLAALLTGRMRWTTPRS
ncbi:MAG: sporulation integral rane protein YlbJ [Symbiobacteriaceae bacterium]|jgi:sporulation integral membrane protein YlbJ|nr:sporulation integral rane protein YlbJ [Symbiobacteriaceae bacterium]